MANTFPKWQRASTRPPACASCQPGFGHLKDAPRPGGRECTHRGFNLYFMTHGTEHLF